MLGRGFVVLLAIAAVIGLLASLAAWCFVAVSCLVTLGLSALQAAPAAGVAGDPRRAQDRPAPAAAGAA